MTDLSPKSMAEAAYTAAVAQMEKTDASGGGNDGVGVDRIANHSSDNCDDGALVDSTRKNNEDVGARIEGIWKSSNKADANMSETLRLLVGELDTVVQQGLGAFSDLDRTTRQLTQSKELAETKSREAQRLQSIDEQSRASLSSLLRAVESSKAEARDSSRSAQVEARLRSELNNLRDERDKTQTELSDHRRKHSLIEEELRLTKLKLSRVMQEKIKMEQDSRAALSLARSLDNNNSSDMNYYKRKVIELSDKLQTQQDVISKQTNTIAELRSQNERKKIRKSY